MSTVWKFWIDMKNQTSPSGPEYYVKNGSQTSGAIPIYLTYTMGKHIHKYSKKLLSLCLYERICQDSGWNWQKWYESSAILLCYLHKNFYIFSCLHIYETV